MPTEYSKSDYIDYLKNKLNKEPHLLNNDSTTTRSYIQSLASYYNGGKPNIGPEQTKALIDVLSRLMDSGYSAEQSIDYINSKGWFNKEVTGEAIRNELSQMESDIKSGVVADPTKSALYQDVTSAEYLQSLQDQAYANQANLMVDADSIEAQKYKQDLYTAIDAEQREVNASLEQAELDAYKQIGYQQQALENQIAENRLKALKSGTTSAQLAAQQLNNMFAAQSGAAEIAANAMNQRLTSAQNYAAQRTNVVNDMYNNIQANKQALLTSGAQNYAASTGYASYVNQQLANLQANQRALNSLGTSTYEKLLNPSSK